MDWFPEVTLKGTIINISDETEFTPRNVKTEAGRKATAYEVKTQVMIPDRRLKPGMPADVEFPK